MTGTRIEIGTAFGPAWADLDVLRPSAGLLILGHGAGGSVEAPDLVAARTAALDAGLSVARITQPYRVAGRKTPPATDRLDAAYREIVEAVVRRRGLSGLPVVHGGRSSGARVACRCAGPLGGAAVIALAFPVHPPGRPEKSRVGELEAVALALLVVQGDRDAFGQPPAGLFDGDRRRLVTVAGADHSLKKPVAVAAAVREFLSS